MRCGRALDAELAVFATWLVSEELQPQACWFVPIRDGGRRRSTGTQRLRAGPGDLPKLQTIHDGAIRENEAVVGRTEILMTPSCVRIPVRRQLQVFRGVPAL